MATRKTVCARQGRFFWREAIKKRVYFYFHIFIFRILLFPLAMNTRLLNNKQSALFLSLSSLLNIRAFSPVKNHCVIHQQFQKVAENRRAIHRAIFTRGGELYSKDLTMEKVELGAAEKLGRMRETMKEWGVNGEIFSSLLRRVLVINV